MNFQTNLKRTDPQEGLRSSTTPAQQRGLDAATTLNDNPFQEEYIKLTRDVRCISVSSYDRVYRKFGFSFLTDDVISVVTQVVERESRGLVSFGAGLGYAEEQLAQRGVNVVAYDRDIREHRWFKEMRTGGVEEVDLHGDRILFMSFPDKNEGPATALRRFVEAGGRHAIVVSDQRGSAHAFGPSHSLCNILGKAALETTADLPKWPSLESLCGFRQPYTDLRPALYVYCVEGLETHRFT